MNNYLIIISKQEFTSLYRFGKIPFNQSRLIRLEFAEKELFNSFTNLPFFEGDEEYLILKIEISDFDKSFILTQNLLEIIPLTKAAKLSLSGKFDIKINFSEPLFENTIREVEDFIEISDKIQGAKSLVSIYFKGNTSSISNDVLKESYYYRSKGQKSNEIQSDFFTHLLVYERYDFFPNTDLGYFYDLGEIFAHYKGKDSFKGSNYHGFLEKYKSVLKEKKLTEIISFVEKNNEIDPFKILLTLDGEKLYLTAVLYLKYKSELLGKDSLKDSNIPKIMEWVKQKEFHVHENVDAIFLLGGFIGFKGIYDDYYDSVRLRIYKTSISAPNPFPENIKSISVKKDKGTVKKKKEEIVIDSLNKKPVDEKEEESSNNEKHTHESNENDEYVKDTYNLTIEESIYEKFDTIESEVIIKINNLFKKYQIDELKLEKKILSEFVELFTPLSKGVKVTKKTICKLVVQHFSNEYECPNFTTIKKKKSSNLFNT